MQSTGHPFGNDPAKVRRYRAFWKREPARRPLVGFSVKSWFPLEEFRASSAWQNAEYLTPEMVEPEQFLDDQERLLKEGEEMGDDILRGASPSQAVPFLCGMLGGRLRILPSSVLAEEERRPWEELEALELDPQHPWYRTYMQFADALVRRSQGRFPVSHGTEIGPSDLMAMLRGHTQSLLDLMEEPERSARLIARLAAIVERITLDVWKRLPRFHGGTFDAQYQLWAPGPIIRMQEDAIAVYSPQLYRSFIQPADRRLARDFECAFMHLHSTSMFLLEAILEVQELGCFEVNKEEGGGALSCAEMIPHWRAIQEAGRALLIRGSFSPEELRLVVDRLDPRGLYLYIMVADRREVDRLRPLTGL